ncbi:MAG: serine hydrolase [Fimbriimonadaceae bacterium]
MTLRQLMSHMSGVRHYQSGKTSAFYTQMTMAEAVKTFADDPLIHKPGETYDYSTHAFTVVRGRSRLPAGKTSRLICVQ